MVKKLTNKSASGTAVYECLEDGKVGNKDIGYRDVEKGELIHCPVRRCFKKKSKL